MPPKKIAATATKKATEPKVKAETKAKAAKAAAPATKKTTKATTPTQTNGVHTTTLRRKRKAEEAAEEPKTNGVKRHSPAPGPATKRPKTTTSPKAPAAKKPAKPKAVINHAPINRLNVYVFGEGSNGELGLGSAKGGLEVKRPRLNPLLSANTVGVVQVAVGGMHTIILTHDNKILTWGINDQSALGRDTTWDGGLKDMDGSDSDSDSDEIVVNPHESTPAEVDLSEVPEGTIWTQVVASDSASFALTNDGQVYGWGTFRVSQHLPLPIPSPTNTPRATTASSAFPPQPLFNRTPPFSKTSKKSPA
jgi:regulator of chromosome condensation